MANAAFSKFNFQVAGHPDQIYLIGDGESIAKPVCETEKIFYETLPRFAPQLQEFVPAYQGTMESGSVSEFRVCLFLTLNMEG